MFLISFLSLYLLPADGANCYGDTWDFRWLARDGMLQEYHGANGTDYYFTLCHPVQNTSLPQNCPPGGMGYKYEGGQCTIIAWDSNQDVLEANPPNDVTLSYIGNGTGMVITLQCGETDELKVTEDRSLGSVLYYVNWTQPEACAPIPAHRDIACGEVYVGVVSHPYAKTNFFLPIAGVSSVTASLVNQMTNFDTVLYAGSLSNDDYSGKQSQLTVDPQTQGQNPLMITVRGYNRDTGRYRLDIACVQAPNASANTSTSTNLPDVPSTTSQTNDNPVAQVGTPLTIMPSNPNAWVGTPLTIMPSGTVMPTTDSQTQVGTPLTINPTSNQWVGTPLTINPTSNQWVGTPLTIMPTTSSIPASEEGTTQMGTSNKWVGTPLTIMPMTSNTPGAQVGTPLTIMPTTETSVTETSVTPNKWVGTPLTIMPATTNIPETQLGTPLTMPATANSWVGTPLTIMPSTTNVGTPETLMPNTQVGTPLTIMPTTDTSVQVGTPLTIMPSGDDVSATQVGTPLTIQPSSNQWVGTPLTIMPTTETGQGNTPMPETHLGTPLTIMPTTTETPVPESGVPTTAPTFSCGQNAHGFPDCICNDGYDGDGYICLKHSVLYIPNPDLKLIFIFYLHPKDPTISLAHNFKQMFVNDISQSLNNHPLSLIHIISVASNVVGPVSQDSDNGTNEVISDDLIRVEFEITPQPGQEIMDLVKAIMRQIRTPSSRLLTGNVTSSIAYFEVSPTNSAADAEQQSVSETSSSNNNNNVLGVYSNIINKKLYILLLLLLVPIIFGVCLWHRKKTRGAIFCENHMVRLPRDEETANNRDRDELANRDRDEEIGREVEVEEVGPHTPLRAHSFHEEEPGEFDVPPGDWRGSCSGDQDQDRPS